MAHRPTIPVSRLIKTEGKDEDGDVERLKNRVNYKKEKEIEDARKDGTLAPLKDERGLDINPHIPRYMMDAPWYVSTGVPTLAHQRKNTQHVSIEQADKVVQRKSDYRRDRQIHFRKGACENCGGMGHTKKTCLEKPRKISAKFKNKLSCVDDLTNEKDSNFLNNLPYSAKRDRWKGYDPEMYNEVIKEFDMVEAARKKLKEDEDESAVKSNNEGSESEDEKNITEVGDVPGQKFQTKQRITVRNLRIREDTAKYLYNLDPNSAFYDPKSRSMRENPFQGTGKSGDNKNYFGDNFELYTGDVQEMTKQQIFAWEANQRGTNVQLASDPTKLALVKKAYNDRIEDYKTNLKDDILNKYGGQEHLKSKDEILGISQMGTYEEYDSVGNLIKGTETVKILSVYPEDDFHGNHTSIWGSYFTESQWGYKCCFSTIYESYCTGEVGKCAKLEAIEFQKANDPKNKPVQS